MFDPKALRGLGGAARIPVGIALCWGQCAPVSAQRPTGGLVAHDPLDGSLEDVTDNACAEVATGSPAYAAGGSGQALAFDGVDDALRLARLSNSVFAGDFSSAWCSNAQSLERGRNMFGAFVPRPRLPSSCGAPPRTRCTSRLRCAASNGATCKPVLRRRCDG